MVKLVKHDLEFILKQVKIAEQHSAGTPLDELVDSALLPYGLRTVDGSYNNFGIGREQWGASGEQFKPIVDPNYIEGSGSLPPGYPTNNDYGQPNDVVDAEPRLISNLVVDQTLGNPAVIYAALQHGGVATSSEIMNALGQIRDAHTLVEGTEEGSPANVIAQADLDNLLEQYGIEMDGPTVMLPNVAPDDGISASYNSFFTLFGQFFDHGLDLVAKGGNGTVYMPLSPDDPLYNPDAPHTNFMVMTRATPGDEAANVTTPWVDQNQTYTSKPSHQVFLREYHVVDGVPVATGRLLDGERGLATWADVKEQARTLLGIELTDKDVGNVPVIAVDPYGEFIRGSNGLPQLVVGFDGDGHPLLMEGDLDNPVDPSAVGAARTGSAFLDDIAHNAVPVTNTDGELVPDTDGTIESVMGQNTEYDAALLDAHYITGDGRGNENIGLSAVHHIFHSEHNRLVDHTKQVVLESGDLEFLNEWLLDPVADFPATAAETEALVWDGERVFQAARFATEMQYQHLVFEEFARKVQPDVDVFIVQPDAELDPTIFAEFANVVYRFGHSMLNETVDRINADGTREDIDLFDAFLNPLAFGSESVDHYEATGAIIRGMTGQVGNEIDEFVTNTLRNQLLGIPLDLAAINIARGRDTGTPTLNEARAAFMEMAGGDSQLKPYESWSDFGLNLKNPLSLVNFIAAYGTHASIAEASTAAAKREAAWDLVMGAAGETASEKQARIDWLNASASETGVDEIDLWVGGLAEKKMSFGGMLGSTFSFIFEMQMESLQDSDRFYYLSRVQGLNLLTELENNSLAKMALRNTDLGESGFAIPADIFAAADHALYMDYDKQLQLTGEEDPVHDDPVLEGYSSLVERRDADDDGIAEYIRYNGADHIVVQGTDNDDTIVAGDGDDTVWGGDGADRIEAGYGVDLINGGDGDDIITNSGTDIGEVDMLKGDAGDDVIHGGSGLALIFGGEGKDFLMTGPDGSEVRAGTGDDFVMGGDGPDVLFGNEGNDWVEGHGRFEYIAGDNGELFFNSTIIGHDVINGGQGDTDYDADSGDDIMVAGEGIQKNIGMWGHDWVIYKGQQVAGDADMNFPMFPNLPLEVLRDRFSQVEALSGWENDDVLRGDDRVFDDSFELDLEIEIEDEEVEDPEEEDLDGDDVDPGTDTPGTVTPPTETVEVIERPGPDFYDPTPEGNFVHNELDESGIARIAGLDQIVTSDMLREVDYWADGSGDSKLAFVGGNILLGGGGSDFFEGRGGDDVIDGDAWLNVRISIRDANGVEIATAEGMDAEVRGAGGQQLHDGKPLTALMLERIYNPGQLHIVREILHDSRGTDTAYYWDVRENYSFNGTSDGRLVVEHVEQTEQAFDPITGKNRTSDGSDILSNIEQLEFGDGVVDVTTGSEAGETLEGTGNDDIMLGMGGDDVINGHGGDDVLIGGSGDDTMNGGNGDDRLVGGAGSDTMNGGAGDDTYIFGTADGSDIVGEAPDGGVADRIVIEADGGQLGSLNAYDDDIGSDSGDLVVEIDGQQITVEGHFEGTNSETGIERINFNGATLAGYELGNEDYFVSKADPGDNVRTGSGDNDFIVGENGVIDRLEGGEGSDILLGGSGGDRLDGGAGADLMLGGTGSDTYVVNDEGDVIAEAPGGGTADTVQASIDHTLADEVENLTLVGSLLSGTGNDLDNVITGTNAGNTLDGGAGDDILEGRNGNDILIGGAGNDELNGGNGVDTALYAGPVGNYDFGLDGNSIVVTNTTGAEGFDILDAVERLEFEGQVYTIVSGTDAGDDALNGTNGANGAQAVLGMGGDDTLNGGGGPDLIVGGDGNDTVSGGNSNDTVLWSSRDGRDVIDGGNGIDTINISGDASAETYHIWTRDAWIDEGNDGNQLSLDTEIVVTRNGIDNAAVIAELDNVEEIVINGKGGGDTFVPHGDFAPTSLSTSTITVEGSGGNDTVDITSLLSAHRIVFKSGGGSDTIIGELRPQDVVVLGEGNSVEDYEFTDNGDGSTTIVSDGHSVTYFGTPTFNETMDGDDSHHAGNDNDDGPEDDHDDNGSEDHDDDNGGEGDQQSCDNGEDQGTVTPTAPPTAAIVGTGNADALVGTEGNNTFMALGGRDVVFGKEGNDDLLGGSGADMLYGDGGNDRILGENGDDFINAGAGGDTVFGGNGDDLIVAERDDGDDTYYGDDMVGGSGTDTLDMSAINANITADLGTGFMGRGSASSAQTGNDTIWGIENIVAGSGDDTITAGSPVNVIDGGEGDDTFRFLSAADADGDTVMGFQPGDRIDLSGIDANECASGNQSFTLVSDAFTGSRGELLVSHETRDGEDFTIVQGNTSGGSEADFKVSIKGSHNLTGSDFNL
ncbi:peroxidase family protein [Chelativorans sp. YIM 93263]|uniref:peroxidase family protein n=1 Tax=Chelativorans sp. YIM 93263 TaxID=2906648 RepID=UPI002379FAE0|nr:peroxidase family protein [Chelativorans sp. YIM 93263]